jgi:hypothetical protein
MRSQLAAGPSTRFMPVLASGRARATAEMAAWPGEVVAFDMTISVAGAPTGIREPPSWPLIPSVVLRGLVVALLGYVVLRGSRLPSR